MITRIEVQGFQSLVDAKLELAKFTVVVGRSSCGKTALLRSLKALHTNDFTKSQITHGEKSGRITVERTGPGGTAVVVLERGASAAYRLTQPGGEPVEFTKLGRAVPEAVQTALGVSDIDLVFANQFGKPFLLDESGSEVARVLGELTNVSLIFAAAREAQRRKLESSALLKTRLLDLALILEQEKVFADLPDRLKGQEDIEVEFAWIKERSQEVQALGQAIVRLQEAQAQLVEAPEPLELPSVDDAEFALTVRDQFLNCFQELNRHKKDFGTANQMIVELQQEIEGLISREHEILLAAGQCPLCLQEIK